MNLQQRLLFQAAIREQTSRITDHVAAIVTLQENRFRPCGWIAVILALLFTSSLIAAEFTTNAPIRVTITVSTNVVNGDNSSGCNMCFDQHGNHKGFSPAVMNMEPCKPYHPATERWVITNVVETITINSEFAGTLIFHSHDTLRSSTTNRWKLASEWKKD